MRVQGESDATPPPAGPAADEGAIEAGVYYACQRCTNCCRWPGFVRVSDEEIAAIARFLGWEEHAFIQRFTRLRPYRDGLALVDQADGACIFLEGRDCAIQPVKPKQCRDFPNGWRFPGWRTFCEAIPVKRSAGEG